MQLIATGLKKHFGPTRAVDGVDVTFDGSKVTALVGENGAGKSTLLKVLAGVHRKDSGECYLGGAPYEANDLPDAAQKGVTLVFQETATNPHLTIAENIFTDRLRKFRRFPGRMDWSWLKSESQAVLEEIQSDIDVGREMRSLDLGERKIVEIARAVAYRPHFVFLDESTAVLSAAEIESFLATVQKLTDRGIGVGFVSHHLEEVFQIADQVLVMKDGRVVGDGSVDEFDSRRLESLMVGREIGENIYPVIPPAAQGRTYLEVQSLNVPESVTDISLSVRPGEVLGIAGLKGSGGEMILRALYGDARGHYEKISIDGKSYQPHGPAHALKNGIAYVPGDRSGEGVIVDFSIRANVTMASLPRKGLLVDSAADRKLAEQLVQEFKIKTDSAEATCTSLSGGNLQKVVLAKCLSVRPKLLLLNNPTRGIDVGARTEIYQLISRLVEDGTAVLLVSEDLLEVIHLSHRILVVKGGRSVQEVDAVSQKPAEYEIVRHMV